MTTPRFTWPAGYVAVCCAILVLSLWGCATTRTPTAVPRITQAVQNHIDRGEIVGAVTAVVTAKGVVHLSAQGDANREHLRPMTPDTLFWIASMSKPITALAVLMLQDDGKLKLDDPLAWHLPAFARLATSDGTQHTVTIRQLLTHTSGLSEITPSERDNAHTLSEVITGLPQRPLSYIPGSSWRYHQASFAVLACLVEQHSGLSFEQFLQQRLFTPLNMRDTTFTPSAAQNARCAQSYLRDPTGVLRPTTLPAFAQPRPYPWPAAGLYSTANDYAQLVRMLLNRGTLNGHVYLSPTAYQELVTIATGDLATGFTEGMGWGLGVGVVRTPQGVTAMLSPGSFGHGGAYGTQAWIDPVRGAGYILMVQRANFANADKSDVRRDFQQAAADWLTTHENTAQPRP